MKFNLHFPFLSDAWKRFKSHLRSLRKFFFKLGRICYSAAWSFSEDDCSAKASALTFYSLLSIVPVLAVAFGIAKGFGFEKHLETEIAQKFLEQREVVSYLIKFAYSLLENAKSGLIAGVGLVVLFYSVFQLLGNIENSFNAIWRVKQGRPWPRRISDYLAVMLFCPIFFATSSSLTIFVVTQITKVSHEHSLIENLLTLSFHLFPLILTWVLFTVIYYLMPNTKVSISYAFLAGVIAGTMYQLVQWVYIQFQVGLTSYGAIYGSFAALPLFLIWLNISWLIALAGAEIAYHAENEMTFNSFAHIQHQKTTDARVIGLYVMQQAIRAFRFNMQPPTAYGLAQQTGIALFSMRSLITQLVKANLLVEAFWKDLGGHYLPARDLSQLTIKSVTDALDDSRHETFFAIDNQEIQAYERALSACDTLIENDPQINLPISEIPLEK